MPITMLKSSAKKQNKKAINKAIKKQKSLAYANTGINRKVRVELAHAKMTISIMTLEFFITVQNIIDTIFEKRPDDYKLIKQYDEALERTRDTWYNQKFTHFFPEKIDRDKIYTAASRHVCNPDVIEAYNSLARSVSMKAARNRLKNPRYIGYCLQIEIAKELLRRCYEKQSGVMRRAFIINGYSHQYLPVAEREFTTLAQEDYYDLVKPIIDTFAEHTGVSDDLYEKILMTGKIAKDIYDFSVFYYDLYSRQEIEIVTQICEQR